MAKPAAPGGRTRHQIDAERDRNDPEQIAQRDVLAEHDPGEHHGERRHQEVIGTRRGCSAHGEHMEPDHIGEDRAAQHEEGEDAQQPPARHDVAHARQRQGERRQRKSREQILDAVADPQAALRREQLEEDGAGDDRRQRRKRKDDAVQAVRAHGNPMPDDEGHAGDAEQQAGRLAPRQLLTEKQGCEHCGEHRIRADDQAAYSGRHRLQPDIAEAEIQRIVGETEQRKDGDVAPAHRPRITAQRRDRKNEDTGKREAGRKEDERRTVGDADLARDKREAPHQAEHSDIDRQGIEGGARDRCGRGDGHGMSPLSPI